MQASRSELHPTSNSGSTYDQHIIYMVRVFLTVCNCRGGGIIGESPLFQQPIWSDSPLFQQHISPTAH